MPIDTDYRSYLKAILAGRIRANRRYSLRAFARDLKMSASRVSQVLRGNQGFSEAAAEEVCHRLKLSEAEGKRFRLMVLASDARSKEIRRQALEDLEQLGTPSNDQLFRQLKEDSVAFLSDWHHFAMLELAQTRGARFEPGWFAARLSLPLERAQESLERLHQLGLLEERNGRPVPGGVNLTTSEDLPSENLRRFQRQLLKKAEEALETQGVEERDYSNLVFALPADQVAHVKSMISRFRRNLAKYLNDNPPAPAAEVYTLNLQLFRVSTPINEKKKP